MKRFERRCIRISAFCLSVTALFMIYSQRNDLVIKANNYKRSNVSERRNETTFQIKLNQSEQWLVRTDSADFRDYGEGNCRKLYDTEVFTSLLIKWTELASEHKIRYFLDSGSLLGAWRDEDFIPYDRDIDINVHIDDLMSLRNISIQVTSRVFDPPQNSSGFHLYFTNDWQKPHHERTRYNCRGHVTYEYEDKCSFTDPMARLFHKNGHVDLYAFEGGDKKRFTFHPPRDHIMFRKGEFFPLVKCNLSGIECRCPKNVKSFLMNLYRTLEPYYVCVNKQWRMKPRVKQARRVVRTALYSTLVFILVLAVVLFYWRRKNQLKK